MVGWVRVVAMPLVLLLLACGSDRGPTWDILTDNQPGALLSVWGVSAADVWIVGADSRDGSGPTVLRVTDGSVERLDTGETTGDLWWVHGFASGSVFMGGSSGLILRYENGIFTKLDTPGSGTIYGLWGSSADDMWAVGGTSESGGGFAWRLAGETWVPEATLPDDVPLTGTLWKMHGTSADDAWIVGSNGLAFHWNGDLLEPADTGVGSSLFTVFGTRDGYTAVGGLVTGIIVENDGSGWSNRTPETPPTSLTGVCLDDEGGGIAVGFFGAIYEREPSGWELRELDSPIDQNLHGVWVDPEGGVWAVGGNTLGEPFNKGIALHRTP